MPSSFLEGIKITILRLITHKPLIERLEVAPHVFDLNFLAEKFTFRPSCHPYHHLLALELLAL